MYQEQRVVFEAEERLSNGSPIVYIDHTAAIMRGRALQSLYVKQAFGNLFRAIGSWLRPVTGWMSGKLRDYRSRVDLMKLDDKMLADIGLSRAEAVAIATGKRSAAVENAERAEAKRQPAKYPAHFRQAAA